MFSQRVSCVLGQGAIVALAGASVTMVLAEEPCLPHWDTAVGQPGMQPFYPSWDTNVLALTVFDDGFGPALYAGGTFLTAGGAQVKCIAKWKGDSSGWSGIGGGMGSTTPWVRALAGFDDGSSAGPLLYAGGSFVWAGSVVLNGIAKWEGQQWSALADGMGSGSHPHVLALTVFDDGSGPALYAGGSFTTAGGVAANNIARWDGQQWSPLGEGTSSEVKVLTVFDDGSGAGPALYAGGYFTTAGGQVVNHIAKWDGQEWSALGSGMDTALAFVRALAVYDDGTGPALYAGGFFTTAGGQTVNNIARWNGTQWSPVGSGVGGAGTAAVHALAVFDEGSGSALYAGGMFITAGDVQANRIAKWNGLEWSRLGAGIGGLNANVSALTVFDDGNGPALYVGGSFIEVDGHSANRIATWRGCAPACTPPDLNCDGSVGVADLLIVLAAWGICAQCDDCPADLTGDCTVGVADLLMLLANWG